MDSVYPADDRQTRDNDRLLSYTHPTSTDIRRKIRLQPVYWAFDSIDSLAVREWFAGDVERQC